MPLARIVEVTIDLTTAETTVETSGFQGKGCEAVVKGITAALGDANAVITHKREFSAPSLTSNRLNQGR
jgi:hypothetical protein